jgi:hypothetical protein
MQIGTRPSSWRRYQTIINLLILGIRLPGEAVPVKPCAQWAGGKMRLRTAIDNLRATGDRLTLWFRLGCRPDFHAENTGGVH